MGGRWGLRGVVRIRGQVNLGAFELTGCKSFWRPRGQNPIKTSSLQPASSLCFAGPLVPLPNLLAPSRGLPLLTTLLAHLLSAGQGLGGEGWVDWETLRKDCNHHEKAGLRKKGQARAPGVRREDTGFPVFTLGYWKLEEGFSDPSI